MNHRPFFESVRLRKTYIKHISFNVLWQLIYCTKSVHYISCHKTLDDKCLIHVFRKPTDAKNGRWFNVYPNRYGVARPPLHGYFKYGKKVITQKRSISHGSLNHHSIRVAELFQIHIKRILFDGFLEMLWRFQRRTWLTICPLPPFFT